jgi:hypothetical protein
MKHHGKRHREGGHHTGTMSHATSRPGSKAMSKATHESHHANNKKHGTMKGFVTGKHPVEGKHTVEGVEANTVNM